MFSYPAIIFQIKYAFKLKKRYCDGNGLCLIMGDLG